MDAGLIRNLNYRFSDPGLLQRALTHRSKGAHNYERLEFLGDSILNFVISEHLYDRFEDIQEGMLSRMRANLVRKETLAALARQLDLGTHLILGGGELKSGGFNRDSILSDVLEAIIGAIYQDGGMDAARGFVLHIYRDRLDEVHPGRVLKDAKTRLQELLQKQSLDVPVYELLEVTGEPHNQHFLVECRAAGLAQPVRGEGNARRIAEQEAAAKAYALLTGSHD